MDKGNPQVKWLTQYSETHTLSEYKRKKKGNLERKKACHLNQGTLLQEDIGRRCPFNENKLIA
jgi:hypothetical protein